MYCAPCGRFASSGSMDRSHLSSRGKMKVKFVFSTRNPAACSIWRACTAKKAPRLGRMKCGSSRSECWKSLGYFATERRACRDVATRTRIARHRQRRWQRGDHPAAEKLLRDSGVPNVVLGGSLKVTEELKVLPPEGADRPDGPIGNPGDLAGCRQQRRAATPQLHRPAGNYFGLQQRSGGADHDPEPASAASARLSYRRRPVPDRARVHGRPART